MSTWQKTRNQPQLQTTRLSSPYRRSTMNHNAFPSARSTSRQANSHPTRSSMFSLALATLVHLCARLHQHLHPKAFMPSTKGSTCPPVRKALTRLEVCLFERLHPKPVSQPTGYSILPLFRAAPLLLCLLMRQYLLTWSLMRQRLLL